MATPRHAFADLVLESALPLPELPTSERDPSCRIAVAPPSPAAVLEAADAPACRIRGGGTGGFTIDFAAGATFAVSAGGDAIVCTPVAGVSGATLRHLLIDHVLPRVLFLRGALVLHASALRAPDGRGVAFLGASGSGKSTLAASLLTAGWSLLSDDALVIDRGEGGPAAIPTYPGVRLWPDVAAWLASAATAEADTHADGALAKVRFQADHFGDSRPFSPVPVPLGRIYLVETEPRDESFAVKRVAAAEGLRRAFEEEFRLAAPDRPSLQAAFDRIVSSGVLPLFRSLFYPRRREALSALHDRIRRDLLES